MLAIDKVQRLSGSAPHGPLPAKSSTRKVEGGGVGSMPIFQWDKDQLEILSRLQNWSTLKLCCKTLSEPELVRAWIKHHSLIVGSENLIVADNGSSDAATLDIYESY